MPSTSEQSPHHRRRTRWETGILITALVMTTLAAMPEQEGSAAPVSKETYHPSVGPLGPITVIGDSVMYGSVAYPPTLPDHLAARGWGPIRARGGVGYTTGKWNTGESRVSYWIDQWRQSGWDPVDVVVNLGTNDSDFCIADLACARDAIMHLVDTIGPGHRIWWSKATQYPSRQARADTWNTALDQIAAEREDFFVWDWPTVMQAGNFPSSDNVHLTSQGSRTRSALMGHEITADLGRASRSGGDAPLPGPAGPVSELIALEPTRIIDTRIDPPGRVPGATTLEIDVFDQVPEGTTAVAAYVSAVDTGGPGYLTAFECSVGRPQASSANHLAGDTGGAVAIVPISPDGTFCLYSHADADLLVDLQAAFIPLDSGGVRLTPLATPSRLVDTRDTGIRQIIEVAAPAGAEAVSISLTAIDGAAPGYLVAYPCSDTVPGVATVNHLPGEVVSGAAFVPVGPAGTICVWSRSPVDVTIDLTGVFTADGELAFVPVAPTRMLDTRTAIGGWGPVHGQFQQIDARVAPPEAQAVSGTLTLAAPMRPGYLRAWGCGRQPATANVTSVAGGVYANSVTTGVSSTGRLCVFARAATATLFDTTGWWVPAD